MTDPNLRRLLDISRMGSDHESRHFAFLKRESLFKPEEIEKNKLHFNTIESQLCDLGVQVIWYEDHKGKHSIKYDTPIKRLQPASH